MCTYSLPLTKTRPITKLNANRKMDSTIPGLINVHMQLTTR